MIRRIMVSKLDEAFRIHASAVGLRAYRQQVLASNIANADTPHYKARDFNFTAVFDAAVARAGAVPQQLAKTNAAHVDGKDSVLGGAKLQYRLPLQANLDGNTVEMDVERAQFAENALQYEANLTLLSMEIKKMLAAIQG